MGILNTNKCIANFVLIQYWLKCASSTLHAEITSASEKHSVNSTAILSCTIRGIIYAQNMYLWAFNNVSIQNS